MSQSQIKVKLDFGVRATPNGSTTATNAMIPVVATVSNSSTAVTSVVISNASATNSTGVTHVPSSVITSGSVVKDALHHNSQQQHSTSTIISGTPVVHPIESTTSRQQHILTTTTGEHINNTSIIATTKSTSNNSTGPVLFGSGVTSAFTSTNSLPLIACPVPLQSSSNANNANSNNTTNSHAYTLSNSNSNGNSSSGSSSGNSNNLCCLTEEGSRCTRVAGNASYSKRIQKTVQQKRLKLSIDSSARHIYICDHHKGMIQSIRTTGPSAVNSSNGPSDRAQRKRKHPRLDDFDDAMIPSPTDLDDGGDQVTVGTGGKDPLSGVDLGALALGTLRRYKKHFHVPAKPGMNKQQLAESVLKHFKSIKVNEKEAIAFFLYMVKSGRNKLDKGTINDSQMNHN